MLRLALPLLFRSFILDSMPVCLFVLAIQQLFQNAPTSMPYQFRSLALEDDVEASNGGTKPNEGSGAIKSADEVPTTARQEDPQDGHRTIIRSPPRNFHSGDVGRAGSAKLGETRSL